METAITAQKIRHLQLAPPLCIAAGTTLSDTVARMQKEKKSCVLICKEDRCIGIFTERDYLLKIGFPEAEIGTTCEVISEVGRIAIT